MENSNDLYAEYQPQGDNPLCLKPHGVHDVLRYFDQILSLQLESDDLIQLFQNVIYYKPDK